MNQFQLHIHNQIQMQLQVIEAMNMSWEKKGSCYISLAFEYFNMGEDQMGIELLIQIPPFYFEIFMKEELKDPAFLEVNLLLIDFMMKSPIVAKDEKMKEMFVKLKGHSNA